MADLREIKAGQQIMLTIGVRDNIEGDYFGTVSIINREKTRIHLKNVTFCTTGQKFSGTKIFYLPEILAVKLVSDVQNDNENIQATEITLHEQIKFELNDKENEIIERLIANHRTIETVGKDFDEAVDDLAHYHFVGVNADGGEQGDQISFIVCCTPHTIYAFKSIGSINDGFKEWLESDDHTKVVHGANILAENLFRCYGVSVKGIFDTKDAHKMLPHMELPAELVEDMDSSKVPRIDELISRAAILLKLYDRLTEQLLKSAYESFQLNMDYCRNKSLIEVQAIYRDGK